MTICFQRIKEIQHFKIKNLYRRIRICLWFISKLRGNSASIWLHQITKNSLLILLIFKRNHQQMQHTQKIPPLLNLSHHQQCKKVMDERQDFSYFLSNYQCLCERYFKHGIEILNILNYYIYYLTRRILKFFMQKSWI